MEATSTRGSLFSRLGREDESTAAWEEFVRIYSPQVLRWCRSYGLQESDAADICQDVLVRFWKQAAGFHYDPTRRFRSYLRQILASSLSGWSARCREKPFGHEKAESVLNSLPAREDLASRIEAAYDTELLEIAMHDVQARVSPHSWRAFEMLAIERRTGKEVAEALGINLALAYAGRRYVQKMIQDVVARLEGGEGPGQ